MYDKSLEHGLFQHKYVAKIGKWPNAKYFYSQEEYQNYLNKQSAANYVKQRYANSGSSVQNARHAKIGTAYTKQQQPLSSDKLARKTQQPSENYGKVSVNEYLTGGNNAKELKSAKKNLKAVQKELKKQRKQAEKLQKQISKLDAKEYPSISQMEKKKKLTAQYEALNKSMRENVTKSASYSHDVTKALYRYESSTLVGQISKKAKSGTKKAKSLIQKYSDELVSAINTPVISVDKNKKG